MKNSKSNTLHPIPILVSSLFLTILCACGRKNNNFFIFNQQQKVPKINRLTLPIIRGLSITKQKNFAKQKIILQWHSPQEKIPNNGKLIGYSIYRFARTAFIPKNPINKNPITTESYQDTPPNTIGPTICYMIRALFLLHDQIIEGPASKIVCTN